MGVRCLDSGWCDYTRAHEEVRRSLEETIDRFMSGDSVRLPVVVAPYGSGKTSLLKHLEWYCRRKGYSVLLVELSELVDYLVSRYGSIHESKLPRVVEEFFYTRLRARGRGVLLVDEVEEAYDILSGVVEHETTPLRGLADAVYRGAMNVLPVLAFGPSSTFKEAMFGPAAWRSRIYSIPLVSASTIVLWVNGLGDMVTAKLVANMVWWASRGRPGWARMVLDYIVPRARSLLEDSTSVSELLSAEPLSGEITDGVPVVDRTGLSEVLSSLGDRLSKLLVLVGPTPLKLVGVDLGEVDSTSVVTGRLAYRLTDVLAEASRWLRRYARSSGASPTSVEHALEALRLVLDAYSVNGLVPSSQLLLSELIEVASTLAGEVYVDDPNASMLLEKLSPDMIACDALNIGWTYIAIRPRVLQLVYPFSSTTPLDGCAAKAGFTRVVEAVEALTPEEILAASKTIVDELGLSRRVKGVPIVFTPYHLAQQVVEHVSGGVLVLASPKPNAGRVPLLVKAMSEIGMLALVEATGRIGAYIYSLLFNAIAGRQCFSEASRRSLVYSEITRSMILEALPQASRAKEFEKLVSTLKISVRDVLCSYATRDPRVWLKHIVDGLCRVSEAYGVLASSCTKARSILEQLPRVDTPPEQLECGSVEAPATGIRLDLSYCSGLGEWCNTLLSSLARIARRLGEPKTPLEGAISRIILDELSVESRSLMERLNTVRKLLETVKLKLVELRDLGLMYARELLEDVESLVSSPRRLDDLVDKLAQLVPLVEEAYRHASRLVAARRERERIVVEAIKLLKALN